MKRSPFPDPTHYVSAIRSRGITIYEAIEVGDPDLWIPAPALEHLLNASLSGMLLTNLALRMRSKRVKEEVCRALGYPVPKSFRKTKPRFPGQLFDTYTQKSNNLQIWNEEISATRRYVLIRIGSDNEITRVKVITGDSLALLDKAESGWRFFF